MVDYMNMRQALPKFITQLSTQLVILFFALILSGCIINGKKCYPIIGLGWVIVNTNTPNATITKTTVVGAGVDTYNQSAIVGYSRSTKAVVDTNSNVIVEIK
jgi:hypothetical protein